MKQVSIVQEVRVKVILANNGEEAASLTADIFNERGLERPQVGKPDSPSPPYAC